MKEMQNLNDPLKNLKNLRKGILISGVFIILPFFFYYDTSSMRGIIGELDGLLYNFPHRLFSIMLLKRGDIPIWNSYILCGFPQLAALQPAALYLPNIFFFSIFSPINAFNLIVLLHFSCAGIFTYLYMRTLKLSAISALFSGVTFMFCGFLVNHVDSTIIIMQPSGCL